MTTSTTDDTTVSQVTESDKAKTPQEREAILRRLDYDAFLATFNFEKSESI